MYIKNAIITFLMLFATTGFSQIQIDDVGDGWKLKVDSALTLIKKTSPEHYKEVSEYCDHITYWMGGFSTTQDSSVVAISVRDMKIGSVNNLACIIVHESHHLMIQKKHIVMDPKKEELECYQYEYVFLQRIPNAEDWLTIHVIKNIINNK
jgi:hypothetical protein